MADRYQMGGHKLYWHLDRVVDWQEGKRIAPIHIDVGLSKGCNIRCEYCYGATQGNLYGRGSEIYFPREPLLRYMRDAGEAGVRSMAFIGEAEPLLNPHVYEAILEGSRAGIEIALGTNGILYDTGDAGEAALRSLTWLRFNISAASRDAYLRIHRSAKFETALEKIRFCVAAKARHGLTLTLGLQMVLTPRTADQVVPLAALGRELGVDYLVVKQCSDTVGNDLGYYKRLGEYDSFAEMLREAEAQSRPGYDVIVKWGKIQNKGAREYDRCLAAPFLLYSSGEGKLFPCGMFFFDRQEEFCMGDLTIQSFKEIIASDRYWEVVEAVSQLDVHTVCYSNCRSHCINEFLWMLRHEPEHVNFI